LSEGSGTRRLDSAPEFLVFLDEIEAIFGPIVKTRRIGRGDRFLL